MKKTVGIVSSEHPHIHAIGCNSHQLNLLLKDVLTLPDLNGITVQALEVSKWFRDHHVPYANLKETQENLYGKKLLHLFQCLRDGNHVPYDFLGGDDRRKLCVLRSLLYDMYNFDSLRVFDSISIIVATNGVP
ncbi:hypothetical protein E4U32_007383 [Claviceps aff. humidiphila group G2b]|nr:hypothetical protein E4U32_007383 [Claviceps aff. humidiphila group G2b]